MEAGDGGCLKNGLMRREFSVTAVLSVGVNGYDGLSKYSRYGMETCW